METKACKKCGIEKNIEEFYFLKKLNRHESKCLDCRNKYNQEWSEKNKEKRQKYRKQYLEENKQTIYAKKKEYRKQHKKEISEYNKQYLQNNREKIMKKRKQTQQENIEKVRQQRKEYVEKYYESIREKRKEYYLKNKERENKRSAEYYKKRKKVDPIFKLKTQMRNLIYDSFKRANIKKNKNAKEILGCETNFFINYLLNTFKDNYGYEWDGKEPVHIDHIKPLKQCNTEEEVIKCCYYTNLQLLKAEDNLKKGDKTNWELEV